MSLSKKTLASFLTAVAVAFGSGFGLGSMAETTDSGDAPSQPARTTTPTGSPAAPVSAVVTEAVAPNVYKLQAHVWVSQYVNTTACVGEVVYEAAKPACNVLVDTSTPGAWAKGTIVSIFNVRSLGDNVDSGDFIMSGKPRSQDTFNGPASGRVTSFVDGDTFQVAVEVWPGHTVVTDVRVLKIDTPEKGGNAACKSEADLAAKASAETKSLIEGKTVTISNIEPDKYGGRVLADVTMEDGRDLAQHLINKGLARPYDGGAKQSWCPAP